MNLIKNKEKGTQVASPFPVCEDMTPPQSTVYGATNEQPNKNVKISKPHPSKFRLWGDDILGKVIRSQMKQYEGIANERTDEIGKISKPPLTPLLLRM